MFCDGCGDAMSAGQKFCGECGKQPGVAPAPQPGGTAMASDGRVAQHLPIVAWLWVAIAVTTLPMAIVLIVLGSISPDRFFPGDSTPDGIASVLLLLRTLFLALGIVFILVEAVHIVAAWGLLHHTAWARILTLAFAFLRILEFPFGTALAIYTIWVLMGPTSKQEYGALGSA